MQVPSRLNKAYTLAAVLFLLIGVFLFANDTVGSWWAAGFLASREAYLRRFHWDVTRLGLICTVALGWCLQIWLKRRRTN